jgi:hypothetical protein
LNRRSAATSRKGTNSSASNNVADAPSPKLTAKVRRPTSRSCAMSRWLFTASAAAASAPTAAAAITVGMPTSPVSTQSAPITATRPKNKNTVSSPNGV